MQGNKAARRKLRAVGKSPSSAVKRRAKVGASRAESSGGSSGSGGSKLSESNKIAAAIVAFTPVLKALILAAEESGAPGAKKKEAVEQAAESVYAALQGSVKELRVVPWETIGPIVTQASVGLIDVLVTLFNSLWGKVWGWFSDLIDGE